MLWLEENYLSTCSYETIGSSHHKELKKAPDKLSKVEQSSLPLFLGFETSYLPHFLGVHPAINPLPYERLLYSHKDSSRDSKDTSSLKEHEAL